MNANSADPNRQWIRGTGLLRRAAPLVAGFVALSGLGVAAYAWLSDTDDRLLVSWELESAGDDERSLVLTYGGGACEEEIDSRVEETAESVGVTLILTKRADECMDQEVDKRITIHLDEALGNRRLEDTQCENTELGIPEQNCRH